MTNPAFARHLIHSAVIRRNSAEPPPVNAIGEPAPDWEDEDAAGTIACRYVQKNERIASESAGFPLINIDMLLFDESEDVVETDLVTDITLTETGELIAEGPFRVVSLLTRNRRSAHHKSAIIERVTGTTV